MDRPSQRVIVIGAGPVGLFGAYYAGVRTLSTAILDSLEEPGGQITAMYPEKAIFDVAGFPAIRGRELVDQLVAQAAPFSPGYLLGQAATAVNNAAAYLNPEVSAFPGQSDCAPPPGASPTTSPTA